MRRKSRKHPTLFAVGETHVIDIIPRHPRVDADFDVVVWERLPPSDNSPQTTLPKAYPLTIEDLVQFLLEKETYDD